MKHKPNPKVRPSSHEESKVISNKIYRNRRTRNMSTAVPDPKSFEKGGMFNGRYV